VNSNPKTISEFKEKWDQIVNIAKQKLSASAFQNWISGVVVNEKKIMCSNIFVKDFIIEKFRLELHEREITEKDFEIITSTPQFKMNQQVETEKRMLEKLKRTIPSGYHDITLISAEKIHGSALIQPLRAWLQYPKQSILIYGAVGRGKTGLAIALLREFYMKPLDIEVEFIFDSSSSVASVLRHQATEKGGEFDTVQKLKKIDLLVLDDFGRESDTDYIKRHLFDIIDYRHANRLPTIMTSNLSIKDISEKYDPGIISRMQEWLWIEFTGKDLRSGG